MRKKDQEIFRRAVELADLANARTGMMSRKDWWRRDIAGRLTFWTAKKSGRSLICNAAQAVTRTRAPFVPADFFQSTSRGFRWHAMQRAQISRSRGCGRSLRRLIATRSTRLHRASFAFPTAR